MKIIKAIWTLFQPSDRRGEESGEDEIYFDKTLAPDCAVSCRQCNKSGFREEGSLRWLCPHCNTWNTEPG